MRDAHMGKIFDGRWQVVDFVKYKNSNNGKYVLRNIYNDAEMTIKEQTLLDVEKGKKTVSSIIYAKFKRGRGTFVKNKERYERNDKRRFKDW